MRPSCGTHPSASTQRVVRWALGRARVELHAQLTDLTRPWDIDVPQEGGQREKNLDSQMHKDHEKKHNDDEKKHNPFASVLVNAANEALCGARFPYFPRGGFPANANHKTKTARSNRWARDWQASSHWCGMSAGEGMLYPAQCLDGRVRMASFAAGDGENSSDREDREASDPMGAEIAKLEAELVKWRNSGYGLADGGGTGVSRKWFARFLRKGREGFWNFLGMPSAGEKISSSEKGDHEAEDDLRCPAGRYALLPSAGTLKPLYPGGVAHAVAPFFDEPDCEARLRQLYSKLVSELSLLSPIGTAASRDPQLAGEGRNCDLEGFLDAWNGRQLRLSLAGEGPRSLALPLLGTGARGIAVGVSARALGEAVLLAAGAEGVGEAGGVLPRIVSEKDFVVRVAVGPDDSEGSRAALANAAFVEVLGDPE